MDYKFTCKTRVVVGVEVKFTFFDNGRWDWAGCHKDDGEEWNNNFKRLNIESMKFIGVRNKSDNGASKNL
jgi:hypothetical protein